MVNQAWAFGWVCSCCPRTGTVWLQELSQRGNISAYHCIAGDQFRPPRASSAARICAKYCSGHSDMGCWDAGNQTATCYLFYREHDRIPQKFLWTDSNQPKSSPCTAFTQNDFCWKKFPNDLHCFTSSLLSCSPPKKKTKQQKQQPENKQTKSPRK